MTANPMDVSGRWDGTFAYPSGVGPATPFVAELAESAGAISGTVAEPNTMGGSSDTLHASVRGNRDGAAVDFTKTYDGTSDAAHSVDYVGRLSGDGKSITGVWSLGAMDGTFEMHRELGAEEAVAAEVSEEVPLA